MNLRISSSKLPILVLLSSRPTEFLPMEYAGIRGLEQKMYKEQETLKGKSHSEVHEAYSNHCAKLATHNAIFFPARVSE